MIIITKTYNNNLELIDKRVIIDTIDTNKSINMVTIKLQIISFKLSKSEILESTSPVFLFLKYK